LNVTGTQSAEENRETGKRRGHILEIVAVVIVLGVLAVIVAFTVDDTTHVAIGSACAAEAKSIRTSVASYRAKHHATDDPRMSGPNSLVSDHEMLAPSPHWALSYNGHTPMLRAIPGAGCHGNG
jgi:hypothetical protein